MASVNDTYFVYRTPHGPVTVRTEPDGITDVAFGEKALDGDLRPSELSNRAANELLEYFAGKRRTFDLPLAPEGTAFQRAVWDTLRRIPYGEAYTTAEVARVLGRPESYRAVGAAVRKNPLAVIVPDHRVVGKNGKPAGADARARLRTALLDAERRNLNARPKGPHSHL